MFLHSSFLKILKNKNPSSGGTLLKRTTKGGSYVAGLRTGEKGGNMGAVNVTALTSRPLCVARVAFLCNITYLTLIGSRTPYQIAVSPFHRFTVFSNRDLGSGPLAGKMKRRKSARLIFCPGFRSNYSRDSQPALPCNYSTDRTFKIGGSCGSVRSRSDDIIGARAF